MDIYFNKYLKYKNKYLNLKNSTFLQKGGSKIIDLSNVYAEKNNEPSKGIEVYDNKSKKKYSPMFFHPENAKKLSKTKSTHLVIPGLLPAPDRFWKEHKKDQIFYMPNDLVPHFHGEAQHHENKSGFEVSKVFLLSTKDFSEVENKQLKNYRKALNDFNNGIPNQPIETWIQWRIPYNYKPYPELTVRKNSIIWWDFKNTHNLNLVNEREYNSNIANGQLIELNNNELQVIVTIMDKVGKFYFMCTVGSHAEAGHKIIINVVE